MHCFLMLVSHFFAVWSFVVVVLGRFFSLGRQKKWSLIALDRWSSYTVMIVWEFTVMILWEFTVMIEWEFARADSALVVLDEWSCDRSGCLNRLDCRWIMIGVKETLSNLFWEKSKASVASLKQRLYLTICNYL